MTRKYRPRLSVELTQTSSDTLAKIIPQGWQKPLFQAIVDSLILLHATKGLPAIGEIISNHINITSLTRTGKSLSRSEQIQVLKSRLEDLINGTD